VKYLFQFNFYPWNNPSEQIAKDFGRKIINPLIVFGIEKKDSYAAFDIFLLFSLFIHRSILKVSIKYFKCIFNIEVLVEVFKHFTDTS